MEKKKSIAQGMGQMSKSLGKWERDDEARRDRQTVVARGQGTRRTTFKEDAEGGSPSAADRRGRLRANDDNGEDEGEDSLVNTVKAFAGKTSETVDKYEEARKKSKINRFFSGVRNIFPKGKKKNKNNKKDAEASSDSEGDGASSSSSSSAKKRYAKQEEKRKEREIGGGKFQEKERKRREAEERKRQSELEARRKQRRASAAAGEEDEEVEDRKSRNDKSSEDEEEAEDRRLQMRRQEHLLKRAQSAPSPAKLEKEESSADRPHGIREKYRAKLEAKKAAALAELHKEEAEKEQARQRQAAKAEEAAINSFLERAAQRRRGTEERVGFRSKRASLDPSLTASRQPSGDGEGDEDDDESAARRRRLGLATSTTKNKKTTKEEEKGKEAVRTTSARTHKKVVPTRGRSEPQTMSGSMGSLATGAAIGGAKLVGRYVQQRLVDEHADADRGGEDEDDDDVEEEDDEEEEEAERAHRWKDRERTRKVNERIEETRRQRQAQAQGRRPSLGKSYSWASPRSGDIPVPLSSRDRMMAAIEGAAARNSNSNSNTSSPRASPSRAHVGARANGNGNGNGGGSGDRTLWHKKARVIRERSQRNLGGSGGGPSRGDLRTTSERRLH